MTAQAPAPFDLSRTYLHLEDGPAAVRLEVGPDFWQTIETRTDLGDGRLVACFAFERDWDQWEVHPAGDEVVVLLRGAAELVLETEGVERVLPLRAGETAVVPRGVWHTVNIHEPVEALHITRGAGTRHRPR